MKFRKLPVEIEAVQWTGNNAAEIQGWNGHQAWRFHGAELQIPTLEGVMTANVGDWIIRGMRGEFYPCKPDIFAATYEPSDREQPELPDSEVRECRACSIAGGADRSVMHLPPMCPDEPEPPAKCKVGTDAREDCGEALPCPKHPEAEPRPLPEPWPMCEEHGLARGACPPCEAPKHPFKWEPQIRPDVRPHDYVPQNSLDGQPHHGTLCGAYVQHGPTVVMCGREVERHGCALCAERFSLHPPYQQPGAFQQAHTPAGRGGRE